MTYQTARPEIQLPRIGGALAALVILLVVVGAALTQAFVQIQFGTVGVVTRFGAVQRVIRPGLNFKLPFVEQVVLYRTQKIIYEASNEPQASQADYTDLSVDTVTEDGQRISVNYTIRFRVDGRQAQWVAQNLGTEAEVVEKIIKTESRIWARNIPKEFVSSDLYTGNIQAVMIRLFDQLQPTFTENRLILDDVGLRSIVFTQDYAQAIENKQIALEGVITARNEAEQEIHRKQATITRAEGEAEAIRLRGQALEEFPQVIQLEFVNSLSSPGGRVTWGILPQGVIPFLDLLQLQEELATVPAPTASEEETSP
ncbi:MAG: SPFH domain-containing protein [Anaerolineae bacterium]